METEGSSSPAGDAVRAELADIMTNTANPLHAGYWKNDSTVMRKIDQKYRTAFGGNTVDLSDGLTAGESMPTRLPEPPREAPVSAETSAASPDIDFQGRVDTALRDRWGVAHDAKKATLQVTAEHLFSGDLGGVDGAIFEALEANVLDGLQPGATVQAHLLFAQFLDDLARLRQGQQ